MVINNSQIKILKLFLENPLKKYSIREISLMAKINYRLAYKEIISFEKKGIINIQKVGSSRICSINLTQDIPLYGYIESLRTKNFQKKHKAIKVIQNELDKILTKYYTLLLFGSYVQGKERKNSDLDLLFILPRGSNIEKFEQEIKFVLQSLSYTFDINVITEDSFLEMKGKQELNIVREVIKNHIILKGMEQYFELLAK